MPASELVAYGDVAEFCLGLQLGNISTLMIHASTTYCCNICAFAAQRHALQLLGLRASSAFRACVAMLHFRHEAEIAVGHIQRLKGTDLVVLG
jgi:hypothetical protein